MNTYEESEERLQSALLQNSRLEKTIDELLGSRKRDWIGDGRKFWEKVFVESIRNLANADIATEFANKALKAWEKKFPCPSGKVEE